MSNAESNAVSSTESKAEGASPRLSPLIPPRRYPNLPVVGGRLGLEPEDFQVDEVPLYPLAGEGQHLFVRLKKREITTPQLVREVARAAGVRDRDVGVAGMKDKHAVTTQWLSLLSHEASAPESWQLPEGVELLEVSHHHNKLRTGHVAGNHFRIRLTEVPHPQAAQAIVDAIANEGLPNYFGAQRFGTELNNLEQALEFFDQMASRQGRSRSKAPRFKLKLFPSVVQAEVFNRYLMSRLHAGLDELLEGEVVRLDQSSKVFVVERPEEEQPRLVARDIIQTGPIWGPKMRAAERAARELEQAALDSLSLTESQLRVLSDLAPGSRRDLIVYPEDVQVQTLTETGRVSLQLSFFLPSGAYATELIRQLTGDDFASVRRLLR